MKIGILTFHYAHNFGAMLQAYALSTVLLKKGYEAEIIDFRLDYIYGSLENKKLLQLYNSYRHHDNCILISCLKSLKKYWKQRFRSLSWYRFEDFLDNTLPKSERVEREKLVHPTFRVIRQSCRAYNLSLK